MGTKLSKQTVNDHSSREEAEPYSNFRRSYAKWEHSSGVVSQDICRSTLQENANLKRHNELSTSYYFNSLERSSSQNNLQNSSYRYESLNNKQAHYHPETYGKKVVREKSESSDDLANEMNRTPIEQFDQNRSKKPEEYPLSPSQSSIQIYRNENISKCLSRTNVNEIISSKSPNKQSENDLQLVLIDQNHFQNIREIGKGNFGTVYQALYKGNRDVALKTLNYQDKHLSNGLKTSLINENNNIICDLLREANTMKHLKHPNLLRIIGLTFLGENNQLSLVTDFMKNGSLLDYLQKHRDHFIKSDIKDITFKLNHFAKQIFQAMLYLEQRHIIHRDLAARNCLIGQTNILKVADFGLTRLTDCGLYKGNEHTICALRWTSPEGNFLSKYTSRSDVWSYGITLWEIFSLGEKPFGHMTNVVVKIILKDASENVSRHLPRQTQFASDELYTHIIPLCLTHNVTMRPRFRDLTDRITRIFNQKIK